MTDAENNSTIHQTHSADMDNDLTGERISISKMKVWRQFENIWKAINDFSKETLPLYSSSCRRAETLSTLDI